MAATFFLGLTRAVFYCVHSWSHQVLSYSLYPDVFPFCKLVCGIFPDIYECICVHVPHLSCIGSFSNQLGKMNLIFNRNLHELLDVITKDPVFVCLRITITILPLLLWRLKADEVLCAVWNMESAMDCDLQGSAHALVQNKPGNSL